RSAVLGDRRELQSDMAGPLADPGDTAARAGAPALERRPLVDEGALDVELVADQPVVRLGVRDGRAQRLLDLARGRARREGEHGTRLGHAAPADVLRHDARLARRHAHPLGLGAHRLPFPNRCHQVRLTSVLRSPECARNVRVGANSPSLCPTIASVTKTGSCFRPSLTAIVCPTNSGKTVDVRDQLRIMRMDPEVFISSNRPIRRASSNVPFLEDLLIYLCLSLPRRRPRTISLSE